MANGNQPPPLHALTLHAEYSFPAVQMPWSMPTIERHRQIHVQYIVAVASDQPATTVWVFTADDGPLHGEIMWPPPVEVKETGGWKVQRGGTIQKDLPAWLDRYPALQVFNGTDFWSILKKVWPESEQGLMPWRRKTRELFDTIKKSKACWFPAFSKMVELVPDLPQHSSLSQTEWMTMLQFVEQERQGRCALPPQAAGEEAKQMISEAAAAAAAAQQQPVKQALSRLSFAIQALHQTAALFQRVTRDHLPLYVKRGGRGANADEVVEVKIPKFQFPVLSRSAQFDSLFHAWSL